MGGGIGTIGGLSAGGFFQWVEVLGLWVAGLWVDYSSDWGIWDCGVLLVRLWRDGVLVGWASAAAARLVGWVGVARLVRLDCGEAVPAGLVRLEREAGAIGEMGGALVTQTR